MSVINAWTRLVRNDMTNRRIKGIHCILDATYKSTNNMKTNDIQTKYELPFLLRASNQWRQIANWQFSNLDIVLRQTMSLDIVLRQTMSSAYLSVDGTNKQKRICTLSIKTLGAHVTRNDVLKKWQKPSISNNLQQFNHNQHFYIVDNYYGALETK